MARMNIHLLAVEIAKRERKKVQVSIGNIREILARLSDISFELGSEEVGQILHNNGKNRSKKRKK